MCEDLSFLNGAFTGAAGWIPSLISRVRPLEEVVKALQSHDRQEGLEYEIRP